MKSMDGSIMKLGGLGRALRVRVAFGLVALVFLLATPTRAQLAITEMLSAAFITIGPTTVTNNSDFWELTNFGTNEVYLWNYKFSDSRESRKFSLPALVIHSNESIIFVRNNFTTNEQEFRAWWGPCVGSNVQVVFFPSPGFSSYGDGLRVYDSAEKLVDSVDFISATRGVSFVYDTNTGAFGSRSILGQGFTCRAETAVDLASPGTTTGLIPLRIVRQPTNFVVCSELNATFRVEAVGMPRPRYQWLFNGTAIPGAKKASYTVTNATAATEGTYSVSVNNGLTTIFSSNAVLSINTSPSAPSVVTPPADLTVVTNRTARFSISVCAFPFADYQWFSNGVVLAGATNSTLFIRNCTLQMSGTEFCVRARNALGTNTYCARLSVTITPDLRFTEVQAAPVTGCDEHHDWFEVTNFGTNAVDLLGYRFSDEPTLTGSEKVKQPLVLQPGESVVFVKNPVADIFIDWWGRDQLLPGLKIYPYGGFSLGKDGDELYLWNATAEDPSEIIDSISFVTNAVGRSLIFDKDSCWPGCDSVLGDDGAFSAAQCGDVGSPGFTPAPPRTAPIILAQPASVTVHPGSHASFSPGVYGTPVLTYQWRRNGISLFNGGRISGATSSILTITNSIESDSGIYSVRVSNAYGSTLSSNATLTVSMVDHYAWSFIPSPQSTLLPIAVTVEARDSSNHLVKNFNGPVALSASINGTSVPVFPTVSGAFVSGVWRGNMTVSQVASNVVLRAEDSLGDVGFSWPFDVEQVVAFALQPTNQNVLPGTNVTLTALAVGTGPVHYQWRLEGANIPDATNASYSFLGASLPHHGTYSVFVTDDLGSTLSSNAFIFVLIRPGFVLHPTPQTVLQGQTAQFSVIATGAPPLYYRWLRNGSFWASNLFPNLTFTNCQTNGTFRVTVGNLAGTVNSVPAGGVALTVLRDVDGDGMADAWETNYPGFSTNNAADALLDFDGDGLSNRDEYVAGTNPTDALSLLNIILSETNATTFQFVAQTNLGYTVQWRTDLSSAVWNRLTNIPSSPLVRTVVVDVAAPPGAGERYYRLVTPPVP